MTKRLKELKRALEAVEGVAERFEEAGLGGHAAELDQASEPIEGACLIWNRSINRIPKIED